MLAGNRQAAVITNGADLFARRSSRRQYQLNELLIGLPPRELLGGILLMSGDNAKRESVSSEIAKNPPTADLIRPA